MIKSKKNIKFHKDLIQQLYMQCAFLRDPNDPEYFWDKFPEIEAITYNIDIREINCFGFVHKAYDSCLFMDISQNNDFDEWEELMPTFPDPNRSAWDDILVRMKKYDFDKLFPLSFMLGFDPEIKIEITRNGLQFI
jgi:hypothetical protein